MLLRRPVGAGSGTEFADANSFRDVRPSYRRNVSGNAPWESMVGYSRAVRVGDTIHAAGITAIGEDGGIVGAGDPDA